MHFNVYHVYRTIYDWSFTSKPIFENRRMYKLWKIKVLFFINTFNPNIIFADHLFEVQRFVHDVLCLSPPWLLIIMSKTVRNEIFCLSRCIKWFSGSQGTVPSL